MSEQQWQGEAHADWTGSIAEGSGVIALGSGSYEGSYCRASRFEDTEGTNPEELLAAAQGTCFSMTLSAILSGMGFEVQRVALSTTASLSKAASGFEIKEVRISGQVQGEGLTAASLEKAVETAKSACPVSRALASTQLEVEITLEGPA